MPKLRMPREISARDAVLAIAQTSTYDRGYSMSKDDIITLARVACQTEGVSYDGFSKDGWKPNPQLVSPE